MHRRYCKVRRNTGRNKVRKHTSSSVEQCLKFPTLKHWGKKKRVPTLSFEQQPSRGFLDSTLMMLPCSGWTKGGPKENTDSPVEKQGDGIMIRHPDGWWFHSRHQYNHPGLYKC